MLLGIAYQIHDRIPVFKCWLKIRNMEISGKHPQAALDNARDALTGILYFRNTGQEPPSKGNVYVKGGS